MQIPLILITRPMTGVAGLDVAASDKYIRVFVRSKQR